MKYDLKTALLQCETDIDGAVKRFYDNEELYLSLLEEFSKETTMDRLATAVEEKNWEESFMLAHALKGLAGNMGFVPLFHSLGELILVIRAGKYADVTDKYLIVRNCYCKIIAAINVYLR